MRSSLTILVVILLLISFMGCLEESYVVVDSNIGLIKVKGDLDLIRIINCTVTSKIYSNDSMEEVDGFVYSDETLYYSVSGFAESLVNYTLQVVNITIRFYRCEYKDFFYVYSASYIKNNVKPHSRWFFIVTFPRGNISFGPINYIDARISC